ncbi:MAG TPA: O-antigen ligase family protein [Solirubrobacteraceae bacterium]|nr:O-antigen ligase family protein [Solirubrobacteraceae bacterium]
MAVWPTLTLSVLGLVVVIALAFRAPPFGVAGAILLYGFEGVIKVGLAREIPALGVAPEAVGAALIDLALFAAVLGVLRQDRGRTLLAIWRNGGRWTRIGLALLAGWLALSVLQIPLTGDLGTALAGLRLTQAYVLALLAGAMVLAARPPERVLSALVAVLLVIAAYAAFRAVVGPSADERVAAFSRSTTPLVPVENGVIFRNIGSFSSAIGLASFLVPSAVFLFAVGLSPAVRLRLAAWVGVALVLLALVATYVRTSLIAIALGVVCAAALFAAGSDLARRTKAALALVSVPVVVVLLMLGTLAETTLSGNSAQVQQRSAGVLNPLSDPSVRTRLQRWRDALGVVAANPLGTGVGTVGSATSDNEQGTSTFADNTYLKILQEQGPIGGVAFGFGVLLTFIGAALGVVRRSITRRAPGIAALSASASFFVLGLTSEAIEQPGKVLGWLFLGVALWAAFGSAPEGRAHVAGARSRLRREDVRRLVGSLPAWSRSRSAALVALLLVTVPVIVSLLRAPDYATTLEVFPARPAGNAGVSSVHGPALPGVVSNPGFQAGSRGWDEHPGFALSRSTDISHSGTASLASVRAGASSLQPTAASARVVLPGAGRYQVQASVHVPRGYRGGSPAIALEGFSRSRRLDVRAADPGVQGRWQPISSEFVVDPEDVPGRIVLQVDAPLPPAGQVLHWDDVSVASWNAAAMPAPARVNLVSNAGFEYDTNGWGDPPAYTALRSDRLAHGGTASLRTYGEQRAPRDTNAGYTNVVFPRAGTYRARAWAYLPRRARATRPGVFLEGFAGSTQLAQRLADPNLRDAWQPVSVRVEISSQDLEGSLVLRNVPDAAGVTASDRARAALVYWDDISVPVMRRPPPRRGLELAGTLRAALEEPQLRFEIASMTDDNDLYDPRHVTVARSSRAATLSFIVTVAHDVPADARRLIGPLRFALVRAARRSTLRRTQTELQELITAIGRTLPPRRRALLQARANVLQRVIGAQAADAVALPAPVAEGTAATRREQRRVQGNRQKVIARLGDGLPPRQRALVQQRADDLQRRVAAQAAEYVVLPSGSAARPTRAVDRLLEKLPGPFPPRVAPGAAVLAGGLCALLLFGLLLVGAATRGFAAARVP